MSSELSAVPKEWPGAFGVFKYSKSAVAFNVWVIVGLIALTFGANIVLSMIFPGTQEVTTIGDQPLTTSSPAANLLSNIVGIITSVAMTATLLAGMRRKKLTFSEAFTQVKPMVYVKFLGVTILTFLIAIMSFLALIVPFFFIFPRLVLATYYLIDKDMGVIDSIKASWDSTKGNVGKVYGIIGASILMGLLILTIIGIPVAIYLLVAYSAAYAILYAYVTQSKQA